MVAEFIPNSRSATLFAIEPSKTSRRLPDPGDGSLCHGIQSDTKGWAATKPRVLKPFGQNGKVFRVAVGFIA
ncbi:MAG: hypothetical protein VXX43_10395, partial [Pseudomonadota bacterium]|nr:hypothetical protein [Pseudomonadota bacterium]